VAVDAIQNTKHWAYYTSYVNFLEWADEYTGRLYASNIRHVRKKLRQQYVNGVLLHTSEDIMVTRLKACVKKEWAKRGKVPRLFVSYDAGCMYANELPEFVKVCMSKPFYFPRGTLSKTLEVTIHIMAKPKEDSMSKMFQEMIDATCTLNSMTVVIYSDDSVYSGNIDGKPFGFNVDISSCDSSNCSLTFAATGTLIANFNEDHAIGLIKQCMLPVTLLNPSDIREKIMIEFHSAFEGSGTVLTTILNHVASYLIAASCAVQMDLWDEPDDAIQHGASLVGHVVTVENWCDGTPVYEKIQFLKHSPLRRADGAGWVPCLNYGCIFRSLGSVDGDLNAVHLGMSQSDFAVLPWADRFKQFVGSVVRGMVHEPASRVLSALRERFGNAGVTVNKFSYEEELMSAEQYSAAGVDLECLTFGADCGNIHVDESSLCRRYDITSADLDDLIAGIQSIRVGGDCVTEAVTRFFAVDYGL
jgi:hypothetical protein